MNVDRASISSHYPTSELRATPSRIPVARSVPREEAWKYIGDLVAADDRWREYPTVARTDRNITLRERKGQVPPEERKSIATNRVSMVNQTTKTAHRLESLLEANAMEILMASDKGIQIQAQFGWIHFRRDGKLKRHMFDLLAGFSNGCRMLYSVRHSERLGDLEIDLELIRNQEMEKHAHKIKLLTEKEISKPVVYRAREILRARSLENKENNALALEIVRGLGGRARVFDIMIRMPGSSLSVAWTAVWGLIDRGFIVHDHPFAENTPLTKLSFVRLAEGDRYAN